MKTEGLEQDEERVQESHEVQQGKVLSPARGEEQRQTSVHAGGHPAAKQLCRKEPRSPGRQVERESATASAVKKANWFWLH